MSQILSGSVRLSNRMLILGEYFKITMIADTIMFQIVIELYYLENLLFQETYSRIN